MAGFVNSEGAVKGLEAYKALFKCCTPPGYTDAYMQEGLDAFKSGQVALQMNWFAFFPGLYKDEKVGGEHIGFFVNPPEKEHGSQLGGPGISGVSFSPHTAGARRLFRAQGGAERPRLRRDRAVCRRLPQGDGRGRRFLGRAFLRPTSAGR